MLKNTSPFPLAMSLCLSVACFCFLTTTAACAQKKQASESHVYFETPQGSVAVSIEIAQTEKAREQGLMYRRSLERNHGMLFVFPEETLHTFWMKNTYLPLDMIFLNTQKSVVGVVEHAEPLTETPRSISAPSAYVLEVPAGFVQLHSIHAGQVMKGPQP